ncbi:MAG: tail fiber domain-containing protein [Bacteroidales bacterium]|nr:tail fiber domain-containing protein [Bacteroidales bacterium]
MKKFTLSLVMITIAITVLAQAPQAFKYQAVVRDNAGEIIANQSMSFRISIRTVSAGGAVVYKETHPVITNGFGLANLNIGKGTPVSGSFSTIDWGTATKFLEVELDPLGGSSYITMGTTQLISVPYALYSENTANTDDADADPTNEMNTSVNLNGTNLEVTDAGGTIITDLTSLQDDGDWTNSDPYIYVNDINKFVGIGTDTPDGRLSVHEFASPGWPAYPLCLASKVFGSAAIGQGCGIEFKNQVNDGSFVYSGRIISVMEDVSAEPDSRSGMSFHTYGSDGVWNSKVYISSEGNVGIGAGLDNPSELLHVGGNLRLEDAFYDANNFPGTSGQLLQSTGTATSWVDASSIDDGDWFISGNDIYRGEGNVGIGDFYPYTKLSIKKEFSTTNTVENVLSIMRGSSGIPEPGEGVGLQFLNQSGDNPNAYCYSGRISSIMEDVSSSSYKGGMLITGSSGNGIYINPDGNVGVGTTNPDFKLSLDNDGGILAIGEILTGTTLTTTGAGTRLIWYPKKSAFRAGDAWDDYWDDVNIGYYSIAMGAGPMASGDYSTAIGYKNIASGNNSIAMGGLTEATGDNSTAIGVFTKAESYNSMAIGNSNIGGGDPNNWVEEDPLFEIGNGGGSTVSNALTVLKNGKVGIGPSSPEFKLSLDNDGGIIAIGEYNTGTTLTTAGQGTRLIWYPRKAAFRAGYVQNDEWDDVNIGNYSTAMGLGNTASGNASTAMGNGAIASGDLSTAMGNSTASGNYSTAMGQVTTASGDYSTAMGQRTRAIARSSTAIGSYNYGIGDPVNWIATDPIFEIGNGQFGIPSNALTVLKNGKVGIGTATPSYQLDVDLGNVLIQGTNSFQTTGDEGILYLGSVHSYIKSEYGYGLKIGTYAAADALNIEQLGGNVAIGTTNAAGYKLYVNGTAYSTGGWQSSDAKFKENVSAIQNPLEKLMDLHGVSYQWKTEEFQKLGFPEGRHYGVIAQEIEKVLPEIVNTDPEGNKAVAYTEIIPVIIEAMKELKAENEALKSRIEQLENN